MIKTEATGKTVEKAIENALEQLQLTREEVDVTVLQEGGLLKQAKVEVVKKLTDGERVKDFIEQVLDKMTFEGYTVNLTEEGEVIKIDIDGENNGSVIGYRGEVLDALQYLASLILNNDKNGYRRIVVDSENYRQKREKTLVHLAKNLEHKVKRTGRPVKLEPMNAYERRIIHTTLQDSKYVSTESDGSGNNRHVVVSPKLTNNILNAPQRKSLNFVYRSDKKRRR